MISLNKRKKSTILFICGATGIILLEIALINSLYYRSDPPPSTEEINLAGLQDTTMVSFAGRKMYQIVASSSQDMFFSAGYLAARDDLFHLTVMSAAGRGELTHVFGETAAPADEYVHYLQLPAIAEKTIVYLNRELKNGIDRYCAGINAGIKDYNGAFPAAFRTRHIVPKPWEAKDVVSAFLLVNGNRSENILLELLAEAIDSYYGREKLGEMIKGLEKGTFTNSGRQLAKPEEILPLQQAFFELTRLSRANTTTINWAINGRKTPSGKPLLIAVRRSKISRFGTWKTMSMNNGTAEIIGVFLPGFPLPFTGTNGSFAWSISPSDFPEEFLSLPAQVLRTGGSDSDLMERREPQKEQSAAQACASTLNGLWSALNAENLSDFLAATRNAGGVDSRYVVADIENNIGMLDNMATLINPESGNIVGEFRAEDKMMGLPTGKPQSYVYSQTARIQSKLNTSETHTPETIKALLRDSISPYAQIITELVVKALVPWDDLSPGQRRAVKLLDNWSGDESRESQEALIFEMTLLKLAEKIFRDEMDLISKDLYPIFLGLPSIVLNAVYIALMSQAFSWYDDVSTIDRKESKEEIVYAAFTEAIAEIEQRIGINTHTWSWGVIHRSSGMQTGSIGKLRKGFWNSPVAIPVDGSWTTIIRRPYNLAEPFALVDQAAKQYVLDLGRPEAPMTILPITGAGILDKRSNNISEREELLESQSTFNYKLTLVPVRQ